MGAIPWKGFFGALIAITATAVWVAPEPVGERLASASTSQLLHHLTSEEQQLWRAAAEELLKRGAPAVPACATATSQALPQTRYRLFHVLEQSLLSSDPETAELAAEALEAFQRGSRLDLSLPADRILSENASLRTSRAIYAIEQLGGEYRPLPLDQNQDSPRTGLVLVDHRWRGGDEGLKHILRLRGAAQMHISVDADVSAAAVDEVIARLPRLYLVHAGQGCLGVEGEATRFGFMVRGVDPQTPAARSGIIPGDVILDVDDAAARSPLPVPRRVALFAPGSPVRIHLRRGQSRRSVTVELGDAFGRGSCVCQAEVTSAKPAEDAAEVVPVPDANFASAAQQR